MRIQVFHCFLASCFIFLLAASINAQEITSGSRNILVVGPAKTLKMTGKIAYVVTKESAKIGWEAIKSTGKEIVGPTLKVIVVKATPAIVTATLKASAAIAKRGLPLAGKIAMTYLKL